MRLNSFDLFTSKCDISSPHPPPFTYNFLLCMLSLTDSHLLFRLGDHNKQGGEPTWRYNATHVSDTAFSYFGYVNMTSIEPFRFMFNYSTCDSSTPKLWGGDFLSPVLRTGSQSDLDVQLDPDVGLDQIKRIQLPVIRGRFDNESASLEISGTYLGYHVGGHRKGESGIGGQASITFEGRIDTLRSDKLLPGQNDTPLWEHTLGYTKFVLEGNGMGAHQIAMLKIWTYGFAFFSVTLWLL